MVYACVAQRGLSRPSCASRPSLAHCLDALSFTEADLRRSVFSSQRTTLRQTFFFCGITRVRRSTLAMLHRSGTLMWTGLTRVPVRRCFRFQRCLRVSLRLRRTLATWSIGMILYSVLCLVQQSLQFRCQSTESFVRESSCQVARPYSNGSLNT